MNLYKVTLDLGNTEVFAYIEESTPLRALEVIMSKAKQRYGAIFDFKSMEKLEGTLLKVEHND